MLIAGINNIGICYNWKTAGGTLMAASSLASDGSPGLNSHAFFKSATANLFNRDNEVCDQRCKRLSELQTYSYSSNSRYA